MGALCASSLIWVFNHLEHWREVIGVGKTKKDEKGKKNEKKKGKK